MSQPQLNVRVPPPRISRRFRPDSPEQSGTEALQHIRALSHYLPGYDYRPDQFQYTETHTTDPDYVVLGVGMMSPTREHGEALDHVRNALHILTQPSGSEVHVSREVNIIGIPGAMFASDRHTSTLQPDLSLWAGPPPASPHPSYRYSQDGVPLLTVEVVSSSDRDRRDNDWHTKMYAYARMGIREYWIVDEQLQDTLQGFTLDVAEGRPRRRHEYRPIAVDPDGGRDSMVLDASLRWAEGYIQCWHEGRGAWVRVEDIPVLQAEMVAELRTWGRILHRLLDAAAPGAADQVLQAWVETAPTAWPSDETLDRLESAPGDWKFLLLGESPLHDNAY